MSCELCDKESSQYDLNKLCCAARFADKSTRDDAARLVSQLSAKYGHDIDDLRNGIARIRRERRKASPDAAR